MAAAGPPLSQAHYLSPALEDKELTDLLLLADVVLLQKLLVQPVGVLDAWHWVLHLHKEDTDHSSDSARNAQAQVLWLLSHVGPVCAGRPHLLQSRRDCDDLLYGTPQTLDVVVPIQNLGVWEGDSNRCERGKSSSSGSSPSSSAVLHSTPSTAPNASCVLLNLPRKSGTKPISQRRKLRQSTYMTPRTPDSGGG